MQDLILLQQLALLATKSRWCSDGDRQVMSSESDQLNNGFVIAECQGPDDKRNAQYLAAASPTVVLDIIEELLILRHQFEHERADRIAYRGCLHKLVRESAEEEIGAARLQRIFLLGHNDARVLLDAFLAGATYRQFRSGHTW